MIIGVSNIPGVSAMKIIVQMSDGKRKIGSLGEGTTRNARKERKRVAEGGKKTVTGLDEESILYY